MEFVQAYEKLLASKNFKEWKANNEKAYLVHFFSELDSNLMPLNWQIGFYDAEKDLITTFTVNEMIKIEPEAEAFKEKDKIEKLDATKARVSAEDALHKARELQMDKYRPHSPLRGIMILQRLDAGIIWNITFMTHTFAALNIKVDASNGNIVHHGIATFFDFVQK